MTLELERVEVDSISFLASEHGIVWTDVAFRLRDKLTGACPTVNVRVPAPYDSGSSVELVQQEGLRRAHEIVAKCATSPAP